MCGCENKQKGGGISKDGHGKNIKKRTNLVKYDLHQIIGTVDGMNDDEKIACSEQIPIQ